jgi:hypothetical protein
VVGAVSEICSAIGEGVMVSQSQNDQLRACLRDTVDFIIEQLELARSPADQFAAIDAAQGIVPFLRSNLKKDVNLAARFMLALHIYLDANHGRQAWMEQAKAPPDKFAEFADDMIWRLNDLKQALDAGPPSVD